MNEKMNVDGRQVYTFVCMFVCTLCLYIDNVHVHSCYLMSDDRKVTLKVFGGAKSFFFFLVKMVEILYLILLNLK